MTNKEDVFQYIDNIEVARENLGCMMPVAIYRIIQESIKEEIEKRYGLDTTNDILKEAGKTMGVWWAQNLKEEAVAFDVFLSKLQSYFVEAKMGILRLEYSDEMTGELKLTIA